MMMTIKVKNDRIKLSEICKKCKTDPVKFLEGVQYFFKVNEVNRSIEIDYKALFETIQQEKKGN